MNIYCEFDNFENLGTKKRDFNKKNKNFTIEKRKEKFKTTITRININNNKISKTLKKDIGFYTTIFCEKYNYLTNDYFTFLTTILKKEINFLIDKTFLNKNKDLKYFIVGLGNYKITADALGNNVVEKILSTTKDIENKNISSNNFGNVFSIAPSIASKNGVYTGSIIKSLCKEFKPDIVILIDSLTCKNIDYLGRTFQINTSGLTPGCEIGNKQPKINKKYLKIPVISIGCPVVCNLSNLINTSKYDPVLTLKDIDIAIVKYAEIIAFALNNIFHKNLTEKEIIFLTKQ